MLWIPKSLTSHKIKLCETESVRTNGTKLLRQISNMLQHTLFFLLSSISLCVLKTSNPPKSSDVEDSTLNK
ncbi:hypothetical protein EYC80_007530 [Monilinia laxa]|uniref:Uncharacterized protein n=1 Tax=Monilinia laxa TaxID=61186 RepID=A0A5N6JW82_MONLA|nr:hypothetical protein EYC80_007530 [Monilinia laxa]